MHRDAVRPHLEGVRDGIDEHLLVRVGSDGGARREVEDEPDISAVPPVTMQGKPHMPDHHVCSAPRHEVDGLSEVNQSRDWPDRNTVIHRYDDGLSGITIHDTFHANFFSSHSQILLIRHVSDSGGESASVPGIIVKGAKKAEIIAKRQAPSGNGMNLRKKCVALTCTADGSFATSDKSIHRQKTFTTH